MSTLTGVSPGHPSIAAGLWRLADPKISLASWSALLLGTAWVGATGSIPWGWLLVTGLALFSVEVAKNASGEVFDFRSGTDLAVAPEDRSPFSGGKRVLVDGLLTERQTWAIAITAYGLALALGLTLVAWREPRVAWLGLTGVALAYFYHAPPLRLSYRGLGELAVALAYGPGIVVGTVLVLSGRWDLQALGVSLPLGILIAAFLWINEFPDYRADRGASKRNLVVRLGRPAASRGFLVLVLSAFLGLLALPRIGVTPWVLLGLGAFLPAGAAARTLTKYPRDTARIVPGQVRALQAFVLYAILAGAGLVLGSRL